MKAVSLALALFLLTGISSCQTPGLEEPALFNCAIVDVNEIHCFHNYDSRYDKKITVIEALGYQCVSPKDYAKIKTHHEVLHVELNKANKK